MIYRGSDTYRERLDLLCIRHPSEDSMLRVADRGTLKSPEVVDQYFVANLEHEVQAAFQAPIVVRGELREPYGLDFASASTMFALGKFELLPAIHAMGAEQALSCLEALIEGIEQGIGVSDDSWAKSIRGDDLSLWVFCRGSSRFVTSVFAGAAEVFLSHMTPVYRSRVAQLGYLDPLLYGITSLEEADDLWRRLNAAAKPCPEPARPAFDQVVRNMADAAKVIINRRLWRHRLLEKMMILANILTEYPAAAWGDLTNQPEFRWLNINHHILWALDPDDVAALRGPMLGRADAMDRLFQKVALREMSELLELIDGYLEAEAPADVRRCQLELYAIETILETARAYSLDTEPL